jgi:shikimate kinase
VEVQGGEEWKGRGIDCGELIPQLIASSTPRLLDFSHFERMSRHRRKQIFLLGFMGSGKSTVGKLLSQELRWPFIDLDAVIEAGQGVSIREIFERSGEPFFRQLEHAALTEVLKSEPAVIALGGGTFAYEANVELVRDSGGTTIWLDCSVQTLRERCATMQNRPLFRDPESIEHLLDARLPYYRLAEFRVSTEGRDAGEVTEQILRLRAF